MFAICRVNNLRMADLGRVQEHNAREFQKGREPGNVGFDHWDIGENTVTHEILDGDPPSPSIYSAVENRLDKLNISPRSNSIVALEYVLTASPQFWTKAGSVDYSFDALLDRMTNFISERHGVENVISISKHFDESTPHVHVVVTPIRKKKLRYKNKGGTCHKVKNRLVAREFTNKKAQYRELQDKWVHFFNSNIAKRFDSLDIDMRVKRGVDVINQERDYIKSTNHKIGAARNDLNKQLMVQAQILKKWKSFTEEEKALNKVKIKDSGEKVVKIARSIDENISEIKESEKKIIHQKKLYQKGKKGNWKKGQDFENGF